jgi:hypothetical protein
MQVVYQRIPVQEEPQSRATESFGISHLAMRRYMRRWRLVQSTPLVAASFIAALGATSINAQTSSAPEARASAASSPTENLLNQRFVITLGGFAVVSNINGSLSGTASTSGQNIDFDKRFGTDADQTRVRAEVMWRITPTQHLRFSYFNHDVRRTRTLDQDLVWGDYTLLAGAQVAAETKFRVYELDYEFAFLRRPNYEIVALAGIHLDDLTLKLSGNASLTVDTPMGPVVHPPAFANESNSVPAPLPVLGLRADWAVSPRIYLEAAGQVFAISYQGISGNWSDLRAGATWMFNDHFGLGVGYNRFATHVDLSKLSFTGRLNFGYQGLLIYVKGGF